MKKLSYLLCLCLSACTSAIFTPKEGDLVFQVASESAMSEAISEATSQTAEVSYDHVGIVAEVDGKLCVIEASVKQGVVCTELEAFLASAASVNGKPGVSVMRLKEPFPVKAAMERAKSHLGEAYDWSYLPDNGKMYCSELVYESYLREDGTPIFTARPMNFRNADGTMPDFWVDLFNQLDEPIPEGIPGTNPNDLAKEESLEEVYRYFNLGRYKL